MAKINNEAFVTLATTDNYAIGALTLAQSLKSLNTNRQLCIMITNDICESMRTLINNVFDHVEIIDRLDSNDQVNLTLLKRPELGVTFSKLHCWKLIQYGKCVFLDADCLAVKNVDDLFERDEFSAASDVGWPDCFNSGVFVFKPSLDTYSSLITFASTEGSFDGGDQGLLNSYFKNWHLEESSKRLPFVYNMTTNVSYSYAPAFKHFSDQVKIVHFIGAQKPWYYTYNRSTGRISSNISQHESSYLNEWWRVFTNHVYESLGDDFKDRMKTQYTTVSSSSSSSSSSTPGSTGTSETTTQSHRSSNEMNFAQIFSNVPNYGQPPIVIDSNQHQSLWEQGQIDYTGRDSFSNILAHLDSNLKK